VLKNLTPQVNIMLIGGGMAFTFLKATGYEVGKSLVEDELLATAGRSSKSVGKAALKFCCPSIASWRKNSRPPPANKVVGVKEIPKDWMGWISGRPRPSSSPTPSGEQKPLSGTAPWGLRNGSVQQRNHGNRPGGRRKRCCLCGGRRRYGLWRFTGPARRKNFLHFHGRRRLPRASGRKGPAGVEALKK